MGQARLYMASFFTLALMYAPQPLYNSMAADLMVGKTGIALLVTVVLLPLAVAPLAYGFLLESVSPRRLLTWAMTGLSLSQAVLAVTQPYWGVLLLRCLQGLLVPAVLTSLMTHLGASKTGRDVQRSMALYVASTIMGAFVGRLVSGYVATEWGWRWAFALVALAHTFSSALLWRLPGEPGGFSRPRLAALPEVLRQPGFMRMYGVMFCLFFVFASLLNFIPFRMAELGGEISEFRIGLMYSGYLMGTAICVWSLQCIRFFRGEARAVLTGLLFCILVTCCLYSSDILITQAAMLLFPSGFFLVHALMPGYINSLASGNTGLVNGCYISFYYLGGGLGSWLPGFLYRAAGWSAYVTLSLVMLLAGTLLAQGMLRKR